jgi:hypothetical protein
MFDEERYRSLVRNYLSVLDYLHGLLDDGFAKSFCDELIVTINNAATLHPPWNKQSCLRWANGNLIDHLILLHLKTAGAVEVRRALGTVLEFSDGPFQVEKEKGSLVNAGMRASDLSEFITAGRNRGADMFAVIDTHHAAGLEIGARGTRTSSIVTGRPAAPVMKREVEEDWHR